MNIQSEEITGWCTSVDRGDCTLQRRNTGMNSVRRSDKATKRRPDQMISGGHEQTSLPEKSPTLKTKKCRELKMRRLVAGSIGSTDTVIGGNTDYDASQTPLGSASLFPTHQSDDKHPRNGEVEGKVGLDHCDRPSDRTGRRVSRPSRNQTSPFVIGGKTLRHRYGDPSRTATALYLPIFWCLHEPRVGPGTEDIENRG